MNCRASLLACLFTCAFALRTYALPAFPGAEGFGANAVGGRGGDVYYVTNLNDDGPGSLRHGITSATGPRAILFKISGNIKLVGNLDVTQPRITIAGQTAPGDGICVQDGTLSLQADDLIVRHIRTRLGTNGMVQDDSLNAVAGRNIIIDHCSASWSVDETLSVAHLAQNVSVQWCFITESLNNSIHSKGPHGYGSLVRSKTNAAVTFHHNLYAHHESRNPRPGTYTNSYVLSFDFRNNVIYDWGSKAGYDNFPYDVVEMNYINNYLVAGPSTSWLKSAFDGAGTNTVIFQSGNRFDANRNGRVDGTNSNWGMFSGSFTKIGTPFAAPPVTTDTAGVAYERVLAQAGATPWHRDAVDVRVANEVRKEIGQIIDCVAQVGGWPTLNSAEPPTDSDNDGMPDYWEQALGLDPNDAADRNHVAATGYTQLEEYLNWLAGPHAVARRNATLEVDLRALNGNSGTKLVFKVADGAGGKVRLMPDGSIVRFVPKRNFTDVARFRFSATDRLNSESFGPETVRVLITSSPRRP